MTTPIKLKRQQVKVGAITYAQLILHMLDGNHTCEELAALSGLHYVTVLQYARELHKAGAAHISSWEKDSRGRDVIKVYKIGHGKDAKRQRMTQAERQARSRAKKASIEMIQRMAA